MILPIRNTQIKLFNKATHAKPVIENPIPKVRVYSPITENALTIAIAIAIIVAIIFFIVMFLDWIADGVVDLFGFFGEDEPDEPDKILGLVWKVWKNF